MKINLISATPCISSYSILKPLVHQIPYQTEDLYFWQNINNDESSHWAVLNNIFLRNDFYQLVELINKKIRFLIEQLDFDINYDKIKYLNDKGYSFYFINQKSNPQDLKIRQINNVTVILLQTGDFISKELINAHNYVWIPQMSHPHDGLICLALKNYLLSNVFISHTKIDFYIYNFFPTKRFRLQNLIMSIYINLKVISLRKYIVIFAKILNTTNPFQKVLKILRVNFAKFI